MHVKLNENCMRGSIHSGRKRVLELPPDDYGRSAWAIRYPVLLTFALVFIGYFGWHIIRAVLSGTLP